MSYKLYQDNKTFMPPYDRDIIKDKEYLKSKIYAGDVIYSPRLQTEIDLIVHNLKTIKYPEFKIRTNGLYKHYGIYIGNNEVIHFQGNLHEGWRTYNIIKTSLDKFRKGNYVYKCEKTVYKFDKATVVNRAKEKLGTDFGGYHFIDNNCEHFTAWCANDVRQSLQAIPVKPVKNTIENTMIDLTYAFNSLRIKLK